MHPSSALFFPYKGIYLKRIICTFNKNEYYTKHHYGNRNITVQHEFTSSILVKERQWLVDYGTGYKKFFLQADEEGNTSMS